MRKLIVFLKPYWHWAVLAPALMLIETATDLLQPRLIQNLVDLGIAERDMAVVLNTGLQMLGLSLLGALVGIACTTASVLASQGFGTDLRDALFEKVQSLSFGNIDRLETGQLITRLTSDVSQVQELVSLGLRLMIRAPLLVVGSLVMAILTSPRLAVMFVALVPLITVILTWVVKRAYPMYGDVQERLDDLNVVMQENLAGVRVVKAFVRGAYEIARFGKANAALKVIAVRAARVVAVAGPAISVALHLGVVAALYFGGIQVHAGTLTLGQIIAFVFYLTRVSWSLMFVSMLSMRVARAEASAARIDEVLSEAPLVRDPVDAHCPASLRGRVAFEGVSFSYDGDGADPVLQDVSFTAEPGETVAVLGATGAGKSSLVHLVPRFYDVSAGRVTVDGIDVRDLEQVALRDHVGVALQESVLFSGSIRDNIRYGRPEASDQEVIAAAVAAQAHDFIMGFPDGYDTILGQRGVNVSGGQKQRIAIARALLTDPRILILDDATSSVDLATELRIQRALDRLMEGRTSFVIAQRVATVLNADLIIVLDAGRIVAKGTHEQLMRESEIYAEIYSSQLNPDRTAPSRQNGEVLA